MYIGVLCNQRPIKPAGFVVLIPCIIVAALSAPHFVAHEEHGQSQREDGYGQKVFYLAISQPFHARIVGQTLNSPIMAFVVLNPIAVIFTVRLVVLLVVGDEAVAREAIVAGHTINACPSFPFLLTLILGTSHY